MTTDNIFDDLALEQSSELRVRAMLLRQVSSLIRACKLTQNEIAKKQDISQSKVSMLVNGKLSAFSAEALLRYLEILGCEIQIKIKAPRSKVGILRHKGFISIPIDEFFPESKLAQA